MLSKNEIAEMVKECRNIKQPKNFKQSFELTIVLKPPSKKAPRSSISEAVPLPHHGFLKNKICFIGGGDLAVRAKKANVDSVLDVKQLEALAASKKEAKKLAKGFDFFICEATHMPKAGRILGPYLGPKGRMPTPVTPATDIAELVSKLKRSVMVRNKNPMIISCRTGDEDMDEDVIAENICAVVEAVVKKLPEGEKSLRKFVVKYSMSPPKEFAFGR